MQNQIREYLQSNKGKYAREDLITELKKAGYRDDAIALGVKDVFGDDSFVQENYYKPKGRSGDVKHDVIDLIVGFFITLFTNAILIIVTAWSVNNFFYDENILWLVGGLLLIANAFFIYRRFKIGRRYFAIGMIAALLLPLLLVGGCFILVFGMNIL